MKISHSSKLYLERKGHYKTQRLGGPRLAIDQNLVHSIPLRIPHPLVEAVRMEQITQPDAGHTEFWPFGEETL